MTEKIIVRREPKKNGSGIILFFPESYTRENNWKIEYHSTYDNVNGECERDYYLDCIPVWTDYDNGDDIRQILSHYARYIRTLPDMKDYSYRRVYRISRK